MKFTYAPTAMKKICEPTFVLSRNTTGLVKQNPSGPGVGWDCQALRLAPAAMDAACRSLLLPRPPLSCTGHASNSDSLAPYNYTPSPQAANLSRAPTDP